MAFRRARRSTRRTTRRAPARSYAPRKRAVSRRRSSGRSARPQTLRLVIEHAAASVASNQGEVMAARQVEPKQKARF